MLKTHRPLAPREFLGRVASLQLLLAAIQLFHLTLVAEFQFNNIVVWLIVNLVAQLVLQLLRVSVSPKAVYSIYRDSLLTFGLTLTFTTKLYARLPYIESWFVDGLRSTRELDIGSLGGGLSAINIFYYPLAILLAFSTLPRRTYFIQMAFLVIICAVDFICLGTRNAPMFVLLFHVLTYPGRFPLKKHMIPALVGCAVFFALFSYSTIYRTQEAQYGAFDWLVLFEFTGSAEYMKISPQVSDFLAANAPFLFPVVFFTHYVSHSIAELAQIFAHSDGLNLGGLYYIYDQFCAVGFCSRDTSLEAILNNNPRAGIYQTLWGSLLFDFGAMGSIILFLVTMLATLVGQQLSTYRINVVTIVVAVITSLSPIENYFYNGLGLAQISCIFIAHYSLLLAAKLYPRRIDGSASI